MEFWDKVDLLCSEACAKGLSEVQAQMIRETAKCIGSPEPKDIYEEITNFGARMNEAAELFAENAYDPDIWDEYQKAKEEGENEILRCFLEENGESEDDVADFLYSLFEEEE